MTDFLISFLYSFNIVKLSVCNKQLHAVLEFSVLLLGEIQKRTDQGISATGIQMKNTAKQLQSANITMHRILNKAVQYAPVGDNLV